MSDDRLYMSVGREINPETLEWVYAVRTNQLGPAETGDSPHALFLFLDAYDNVLDKRWIRVTNGGATQVATEQESHALNLGCQHFQQGLERNKEYREYLLDILVTAVEGGIDYWADIEQYEADGTDPFARITEKEDDGSVSQNCYGHGVPEDTKCESHMLTLEAIERGIAMCRVVSRANYDSHNIAQAEAEHDAGHIDAIGADIIAQFAIFGDIVYG